MKNLRDSMFSLLCFRVVRKASRFRRHDCIFFLNMRLIRKVIIATITFSMIMFVWNTFGYEVPLYLQYCRTTLKWFCEQVSFTKQKEQAASNHSQGRNTVRLLLEQQGSNHSHRTFTTTLEQPTLEKMITVLVKTVNRRDKVWRLVASIEEFYPNKLNIIIGDDGRINESVAYQEQGVIDDQIRYIWFGYDIGLSAARNRLVNLCKTKYVINMDDDMQWTKHTDIYKLVRVITKTNAHLVTMALIQDGRKRHYLGELYLENKTHVFCQHHYASNDSKRQCPNHKAREAVAESMCYQTDIGLNIFLARTKFLLENPWNEALKMREHKSWFWALRQHTPPAKIIGCIGVEVTHNYVESSPEYMKMRNRVVNSTFNWKYVAEYEPQCCKLAQQREAKANQR